jgi:hypothetical protein
MSEDGNAFIVGPWSGTYRGWSHAPKRFPPIAWTSWTTSQADGVGAWVAGDCKPSCVQGTFRAYPVRLVEWRPRSLQGQRVFTRLRWTYMGSLAAGMPRSVTADAQYEGGGVWGWNPSY